MIIQIKLNNNNYKVEATSDCYTAYKLGTVEDKDSKNFGNTKETALDHFSQLPNALNKLVREEIGSSGITVSLDEYITRVQALNKEIKNQMEDYGI